MKTIGVLITGGLLAFSANVSAMGGGGNAVVQEYLQANGGQADAEAGRRLWMKQGVKGRSCTTCHGKDLTRAGKHKRTGKRIEPMAPSVNPKRLTDPKKVAKWFKRNCKWTLGRECTLAEKADVLVWLKSL